MTSRTCAPFAGPATFAGPAAGPRGHEHGGTAARGTAHHEGHGRTSARSTGSTGSTGTRSTSTSSTGHQQHEEHEHEQHEEHGHEEQVAGSGWQHLDDDPADLEPRAILRPARTAPRPTSSTTARDDDWHDPTAMRPVSGVGGGPPSPRFRRAGSHNSQRPLTPEKPR
ncbi:hypothetical protein [Janibacter indicus]|uniref:hypothetical protein n=1 Tax=Janibacter indicus TaxID=857417 RepID=UPI003EB977E7